MWRSQPYDSMCGNGRSCWAWRTGELFIPQTYQWGQEGQVDWYEAYAEIDGERQKVYVFCMRSMGSGGAFHRAYPHASRFRCENSKVGFGTLERCPSPRLSHSNGATIPAR